MDQSKVDQLVQMTGIQPNMARHFLEVANGDLQSAVELALDDSPVVQKQVPKTEPTPKPAPRPQPSGGIMGFNDIRTIDPDDSKRDSYYAGGEKSGIAILDPNKHKDEVVDKVFESAHKHGATSKGDMPPEEKEKFSGVGYTLGNNADTSKLVAPVAKPPGLKPTILTFWKNCFTVDDGPPRKFDDPENASFLNDVQKGIVPRELQTLAGGADLNIELIRKNEEYKPPPKPSVVAFSGSGHSLGGTSSGSATKAEAKLIVVDESQPTTTLQIRLHDGSRLVIKCNHTHTVGNVRSHIEASKPTGKAMELRTTFPNKVLSDDSDTIKDAGLLNATIAHRLI